MAKAKKLPSGSWRIQVYDYKDTDGKIHRRSFTAATKAEAEYMAADFVKNHKGKAKIEAERITVRKVLKRYIELSAMLSPSTISGIEKTERNAFPHLMDMDVTELTDEIVQEAINQEARRAKKRKLGSVISAKTVKNEWGNISAALYAVCKIRFNVRLPKVQRQHKDLPIPELLFSILKGSSIELPCLLAMWLSFTMSEIRGFMCSSIRGGYIYVEQVIVDVDGLPVLKTAAKTNSRVRKQAIPEYIMKLIEESESYKEYITTGIDRPLIPLNHRQIYGRYKRLMSKHGIFITFHDLRHMFASIMLTRLNIPEKVVQVEGGWATDSVMKSVYSNTFTDSRSAADKIRDEYFNNML